MVIHYKILKYTTKQSEKKDFDNHENHAQNDAVSSVVNTERDDVHFECGFLNQHFKSHNINVEKDLRSDGFFIKKKKKNKMKKTTDCTKLKFLFSVKEKNG